MAADQGRAKSIFLNAAEIASPAEREAYLEAECGGDESLRREVGDLLSHHAQARAFLQSPAPALGATVDEPPVAERPGIVIGPYKLLQQIGEGGMGVVFMAEQTEPVKRKVALKIIKPGMDSRQVVARFEAERQALAIMDHVNIARVFDGGTTENGRPYFVMELVHGVPITKYCDDNHLTPRQRLELFVPVCQAIQHAHQKGIIHRDIKPSNVMVTLYDGKPVPKVIDFGVAKATEQKLTERTLFTQYGTMVGTLEYMSPEQAEMSALGVDTRSDIYSLGVLLYELLTGSTPLTRQRMKEAAYAEILRMIKEEEPSKPSTRLSDSGEALASISANRHTEPTKLAKLVRGELDWIVMKALEKDRNRRYGTANDFAADVQRYLNDEQVLACPPSVGYRLRKFVRRNRHTLATLLLLGTVLLVTVGIAGVPATVVGAVVLAILTAGLVLLAEANRRTRQQRELAENSLAQAQAAEKRAKGAAARAEAINHFLINDLLAEAAPERNAYGNQVTVEELLNRAARKIDRAFPDQPEIEGVIRLTIGRTYHSLGQWELAEPHLYRAVELRRAFLGPEHPETLEALNDLAVVLEVRGKLAEAEPLFRQALSGCCEVLGQDHPLTLLALHNLGWSLHDRGNAVEAEVLYRECLEARLRLLGREHPDTLTSLHHLAWLLWDQDNPAEAGPMLREVLTLRRQVLPAGHPDITKTLTLLGWVLTETCRAPEAEPLLHEALAVRRKALPTGHWLTAITANILGGCLTTQGRYAEAEPLLVESCEKLQTASGFPPGRIPEVLGRLVELYEALGRDQEAEVWRRRREAAGRLTERPGRACGPRRMVRKAEVQARHT